MSVLLERELIPGCHGPSGITAIPGNGADARGTVLMREPLHGIGFTVLSAISKKADLFSMLPMMHEAEG